MEENGPPPANDGLPDKIYSKLSPGMIRIVIIICILLIGFLMAFMSYVYGAAKICQQVEGFLDEDFVCHISYYKNGQPNFITTNYGLNISIINQRS